MHYSGTCPIYRSHCNLPTIIMQPDRQKKLEGKKSRAINNMAPFASPKTQLLSGRQLISYLPLYLFHTSSKVKTTDFMPGILHTQTLQKGRKCTWLPNAAKICHLSFHSKLFAPAVPFIHSEGSLSMSEGSLRVV